jgi:DUF1680 family protein
MKIHLIFAWLILSGFILPTRFDPPVNSTIHDVLQPPLSDTLMGYLGEKLGLSYRNRILAQDADRLVAPFTQRTETNCWQDEFWGKWFTSAVLAYRYYPSPGLKEKLDHAVESLMATQTPDGYIGNYAPDYRLAAWDIWGNKYCMLGLLTYYDLTGKKAVLRAACGIADNLMHELKTRNIPIVKTGNHRGMASSSVLEPICLLYERTGDKKYLDFAREIVNEWETPEGPQLITKSNVNVAKRFPKPLKNWYGWDQGQKAYEMMSCYEGLLELFRITGQNDYKQAVISTWQNILDTEINIAGSGAAMECWFGGKALQDQPIHHYQETCVTVTWIKLCLQLLRLTGEPRYADAIESAYYNALLGAMYPDGSDWAKYSPLTGQRMPGSEQCDMGLNCCVANGPRGLFIMPQAAIMSRNDGLQVNFFVPGRYTLSTPSGETATLLEETNYPAEGSVILEFKLTRPEEMTFRVRIPSWSRNTTLAINGEKLTDIVPGTNAQIHKKWVSGDRVTLQLDMEGQIIHSDSKPGSIAILRGPVVLAEDSRLAGLSLDAAGEPVVLPGDSIHLVPVKQKNPEVWMEYTVQFIPESYTEEGSKPIEVPLCDYSSAGNTYNAKSRFRSWFPLLLDPSKHPGQ